MTEMSDEAIISKLDELICVQRAASIPFSARYLDAEACGGMLGFSGRHFAARIACKPGFPKPIRIDGGHARWKGSDVIAWADSQRGRTQKVRQAA